jgi:glycine/D-amino acid oxidase-like deaminating enzyme
MAAPQTSADLLVVGAGVVGLSIALELRQGAVDVGDAGGTLRMSAAAVAGERDTVLDILDSRRFREGRTVPEPQVI